MASAERRAQVQAAVLGAEVARRAAKTGAAPWPRSQFPKLQPPPLDQLRRLLDPDGPDKKDREVTFARATVAALLSTQERLRQGGQVERVLSAGEQDVYKNHVEDMKEQHLQREKLPAAKQAPVCSHCDLLNKLTRGADRKQWPSITIKHDAEISAGFDNDTYISTGELKDFLVLTRDLDVAMKMVRGAHPLFWSQSAGDLFKQSEYVTERDGAWYTEEASRDVLVQRLKKQPAREFFLYEYVERPWTEYVTYETENVIRISGFNDNLDGQNGPRLLAYEYNLQVPIRSNFGVAWETGGLDVDSGHYRATIEPVNGTPNSEGLASFGDGQLLTLKKAANDLSWHDAYLVTIEASKSLRYTTPTEGPPELRAFLNWTSPAMLFTFLYLGICAPVHAI